MNIRINGSSYNFENGETVLEVAKREGIKIPFLCNHPYLCVTGSCRLCIVKDKNCDEYFSACSRQAEEGMDIVTGDRKIEQIRRINLELLFSQHKEECHDCVWNPGCKLLSLAREYGVTINRFTDRKDDYPELSFGGIIDFDSSKCIDCRNCIEVCERQNVSFLEMKGRGHLFEVEPAKDRACVYCGQCILRCPAGSFEGVGEFEKVSDPIDKNGDKEIIFQIAPAARISISEEFGLEPGTDSTGKLVSALKEAGADKVFDVSVGADFTTHEEAEELIERIESGENLPMLTSCCPAWVRFIEFYYPQFVDNLTTVRSPHIILGSLIKQELKGRREKVVVSVMPCVAKKYEIMREELKVGSTRPVDYVLTVREVGRLLRDKGVDFKNLPDSDFDNPFGEATGDGVGYGASGGVIQAAIREAHFILTGERSTEEIRDNEDFILKIGDRKIKTKRASGLSEAVSLLEDVDYDYLEFMACPGGCIGGGGQPVPTTPEIRDKRREGLFRSGKKKKKRSSFDSDIVSKLKNKTEKDILRTEFKKRKNPERIDRL